MALDKCVYEKDKEEGRKGGREGGREEGRKGKKRRMGDKTRVVKCFYLKHLENLHRILCTIFATFLCLKLLQSKKLKNKTKQKSKYPVSLSPCSFPITLLFGYLHIRL